LHRRDRPATGGRDPLLELAHLVGQGRLVTDGRRHAAEQRGDLGTGLGEPEDVVDEQQHVLVGHVAEVLRHRQRGQGHPHAGSRGSSIGPNTRAVSLRTLASPSSMMRSLPSRVRSPTPANTDVPPKLRAIRLIISWMSTVLPTPAPPNRPILPPRTYGVSRSM